MGKNFELKYSKILIQFYLYLLAVSVSGLKVKSVTVPGYSVKGDSVPLDCHYDLEGDQLYSVSWYKGFREFYRYVPAEKPKVNVFKVPGVNVDVSIQFDSKLFYIYMTLQITFLCLSNIFC